MVFPRKGKNMKWFCNKEVITEAVLEEKIQEEVPKYLNKNLNGFIASSRQNDTCYVYLILHDLGNVVMMYDIYREHFTFAIKSIFIGGSVVKAPDVLINQVAEILARKDSTDFEYFSHLASNFDEITKRYYPKSNNRADSDSPSN